MPIPALRVDALPGATIARAVTICSPLAINVDILLHIIDSAVRPVCADVADGMRVGVAV
jgi:hypothetical protein